MRRIKLTLGYDGTGYAGWQRQVNGLSIQQAVETALHKLTGERISVTGASRTDAGVHALGQVCHFDMQTNIPDGKIPLALNTKLPKSIRAYAAETVDNSFHARFDAKGKLYRYFIYNDFYASVLERNYCWHVPQKLDVQLMDAEARLLIGRHDFSAFRASGSSAKTTIRTVFDAGCRNAANLSSAKLEIWVHGDHFLYNMVRIFAGTLVEVGMGKRVSGAISKAIESGDRRDLGQTAPPHGLVLERVFF